MSPYNSLSFSLPPSLCSLLGLLKCVSHRSTACWIRVSLSVLALVLTHPLFDSRQQLFLLSSPPPACPSLAPLSPMFICSICGWTIDTIVFASRLDLCYTPLSLSLSLWAIFNYLYYVSVASLITLHNEFVDNDSGNISRCFFQIFVNCRGYGYPVGHLSHTWWSEAWLSRFPAFPFAVWLRFHHHNIIQRCLCFWSWMRGWRRRRVMWFLCWVNVTVKVAYSQSLGELEIIVWLQLEWAGKELCLLFTPITHSTFNRLIWNLVD